jgi:aminoglycoside phosphotransferase (APT) family kinase protein
VELGASKPALEAWLAAAAGADAATVTDAQPLSGGAIQENWLLNLEVAGGAYAGHQALVLRTDAPSSVAVSLSRAQEFAVLQAVWAAGVSVPEPLWLCSDTEVLGRPFYVMRQLHGVALGSRVVKDASLGGDRAGLVERIGREMARIHAIRPPRADLAFLDAPDGNPALHEVAGQRAHLDALDEPRPVLEWGLRWAERHAPACGAVTLVHRDFRTGNILLDAHGLAGVLDWEFAAWGDPMSDLGWFCARCWRFGKDELEAGGLGPREALYRGYEAESGRSVDDAAVRYWEVMAHIRWAVIALQQGRRHVSGGEESLELALVGRRPAELEYDLLAMTAPEHWTAAGEGL